MLGDAPLGFTVERSSERHGIMKHTKKFCPTGSQKGRARTRAALKLWSLSDINCRLRSGNVVYKKRFSQPDDGLRTAD
jgi:hypothetical protein